MHELLDRTVINKNKLLDFNNNSNEKEDNANEETFHPDNEDTHANDHKTT